MRSYMEYENKKERIENVGLFKIAEKLKPKFSSSGAAINFYTGKLEEISSIKKCTILELIKLAEINSEDEILSEVLSFSRKISFLKNQDKI